MSIGLDAAPQRGLTAAPDVARAYDLVLDANFAALPGALATACGPAPSEACDTLEAVALAWRLMLDPADRSLDRPFATQVAFAIGATDAWTRREPDRAEAWFYLGAAYGARVQAHVLRGERLAAVRDGKRVKDALDRALALDPALHDAEFGIGVYRYYAAIAPTALRMLRWILMLPGGDRQGGLRQMAAASEQGELVRGEADYQLHIAYLWYENRAEDALRLIDSLRARYPRNPLFHQARAEILDTYFHDRVASLRAWDDLQRRADARLVHEPVLASTRAAIAEATLLDTFDETDRAVALLERIASDRPARPAGAMNTIATMLPRLRQRWTREPYRTALEGWRAFERGDLVTADRALTQALTADPANSVTRYRYAQLLLAQHDDDRALRELQRVIAPSTRAPAVTRASALVDAAQLMERRGDRARARAFYLDASHVFGADRALTDRAAARVRALDRGSSREIAGS